MKKTTIEHAGCKIQVSPMVMVSGDVRYNSIVQYLGPASAATIGTLWSTGDESLDAAVARAKQLASGLAALCAGAPW